MTASQRVRELNTKGKEGMTLQALERRDSHSRITVTRVITHRRKQRCDAERCGLDDVRCRILDRTMGVEGAGRVVLSLCRRLGVCRVARFAANGRNQS